MNLISVSRGLPIFDDDLEPTKKAAEQAVWYPVTEPADRPSFPCGIRVRRIYLLGGQREINVQ